MTIETRVNGDIAGPETPARALVRHVALVVAAIVHAVAGFAVVVSGLVAPDWARAVLALVWLVGLVLLIAWRRRPVLVIGVPITVWAVIIGTVVIGDVWLGWTA